MEDFAKISVVEISVVRNNELFYRYMCGPTVYDSAHIGHASSYVRFDIIRRIMGSVFDVDAMLVMGITDIDDKIIRRVKEVSIDIALFLVSSSTETFFCEL